MVNGVGGGRALDLAELLVWTRATTTTERASLVEYLGNKWGFNGAPVLSVTAAALPPALGYLPPTAPASTMPDASALVDYGYAAGDLLPDWWSTLMYLWEDPALANPTAPNNHSLVLTNGRYGVNNSVPRGRAATPGMILRIPRTPLGDLPMHEYWWTLVFRFNASYTAGGAFLKLSTGSANNELMLYWTGSAWALRRNRTLPTAKTWELGITGTSSPQFQPYVTQMVSFCYHQENTVTAVSAMNNYSLVGPVSSDVLWGDPTQSIDTPRLQLTPSANDHNITLFEIQRTARTTRSGWQYDQRQVHASLFNKWSSLDVFYCPYTTDFAPISNRPAGDPSFTVTTFPGYLPVLDNSVSPLPGQITNCMKLSASGWNVDYTIPALNQDFTIQFWIYNPNVALFNATALLQFGAGNYVFGVFAWADRMTIGIYGTQFRTATPHNFQNNTWTYVCITRSGGVLSVDPVWSVFTGNAGESAAKIRYQGQMPNQFISGTVRVRGNNQPSRFADLRIISGRALDGTVMPTAPLGLTVS